MKSVMNSMEAMALAWELMANPLSCEDECSIRLKGMSRKSVAEALVDILDELPEKEDDRGASIVENLKYLGAEVVRKELEKQMLDRSRPLHIRAFACLAWMFANRGVFDPPRKENAEELFAFSEMVLLNQCFVKDDISQLGQQLLQLAQSIPPQFKEPLFESTEKCRKLRCFPVSIVYGPSLKSGGLGSIEELMTEAVVEEASKEAIALLRELAEKTKRKCRRKLFKKALSRCRQLSKERQVSGALDPVLHIATCDGVGAFLACLYFPTPWGRADMAELCLHVDGDVRTASVHRALREKTIYKLMETQCHIMDCEFAMAPPAEGAAIVRNIAHMTRQSKLPLPEGAVEALEFFERIEATRLALLPAEPSKLDESEVAKLRLLLGDKCTNDWFFVSGELEEAGVRPPGTGRPAKMWVKNSARALTSPALKESTLAMAEHMARWHLWQGNLEQNHLFTVAAAEIRKDFSTSSLVKILLERSAGRLPSEPEPYSIHLGNTLGRNNIYNEFFKEVQEPTLLDQAIFDLSTAAREILDHVLEHKPASARPRYALRTNCAHQIGKLIAEFRINKSRASLNCLNDEAVAIVTKSMMVEETAARKIAKQLVAGLITYIDVVCNCCPVNCFANPEADGKEVFLGYVHPLVRMQIPLPEQESRFQFHSAKGEEQLAAFVEAFPPNCKHLQQAEAGDKFDYNRAIELMDTFACDRSRWSEKAVSTLLSGRLLSEADADFCQGYLFLCHRSSGPGGLRLIDMLLQERGAGMEPSVRRQLEKLASALFSLYEVDEVKEGVGLSLINSINGEKMFVHEVAATFQMKTKDLWLGWIAEVGDHHELVIGGVSIPKSHKQAVLKAIQNELKTVEGRHSQSPLHEKLGRTAKVAFKAYRKAMDDCIEKHPPIIGADGSPLDKSSMIEIVKQLKNMTQCNEQHADVGDLLSRFVADTRFDDD